VVYEVWSVMQEQVIIKVTLAIATFVEILAVSANSCMKLHTTCNQLNTHFIITFCYNIIFENN